MKNKIVLITGATSGIGRACAHKFASMGADIILNGRKVELMEEIKNELVALGVDVLLLPFDVRDREAMRAAVDSLEGKWKNIDVLITIDSAIAHLAGAMGVKTFLLLPYASEWRWFVETEKTDWYDSVRIFKQSQYWQDPA